MVGFEGAAEAAFLPIGAEHEMVDDQLAASFEEIGQCDLPVRTVENVLLVDFHPREGATLGGELIAHPGKAFFIGKMLFAGIKPFLARNDLMTGDWCGADHGSSSRAGGDTRRRKPRH